MFAYCRRGLAQCLQAIHFPLTTFSIRKAGAYSSVFRLRRLLSLRSWTPVCPTMASQPARLPVPSCLWCRWKSAGLNYIESTALRSSRSASEGYLASPRSGGEERGALSPIGGLRPPFSRRDADAAHRLCYAPATRVRPAPIMTTPIQPRGDTFSPRNSQALTITRTGASPSNT